MTISPGRAVAGESAASDGVAQPRALRSSNPWTRAVGIPLTVVAVTVVGLVLRWATLGESFFGDELFTYDFATRPTLSDVMAGVLSDDEMTPPLFFVLAWMAQHLGDPFLWLRMVSMVSGVAMIPLVYVLGRRTVGQAAGLVGSAFMALSPMAIFFSSEARAYSLLMFLVVLSTLALLRALETRDWRWWALVSLLYAGAMYTHYTCIFVLTAQAGWALWTHREQWRSLVISMGAAAVLFTPWIPAFLADGRAPNQAIIGLVVPFGPDTLVNQTVQLVVGSSYTRLSAVPGLLACAMLAAATALGLAGLIARWWKARRIVASQRVVLIAVLAVAAPVGAGVYSMLSNDIFIARNLISSLPAVYLALAALFTTLWRPAAAVALGLAFAALGWAAVTTQNPANMRPPNAAVARYLDVHVNPGDAVLELNHLVGHPAEALRIHLPDGFPYVRALPGQPVAPTLVPPGGRLHLVGTRALLDANSASYVPPGYRQSEERVWSGGLYGWPTDSSLLSVVTWVPEDDPRS